MRRLLRFTSLGCLAFLPWCSQAQTITPLGVLYAGEESTLELPYLNEGSGPVRVESAETSCECLVPQFVPTDVPVGETRTLTFTYRSNTTGRMRVDIKYFGASAATVLKQRSVSGIVVDRKLFLTSEQLRSFQNSEDVLLVDLRAPDRFEKVHLPRALNLPAFVLKHRADLKTRKLVLIDEGIAPAFLAEEALRLRESGFGTIYVLEGGIAAWIRSGGAVEGVASSALAASHITPAEFLRSQKTDQWQVINAAESDSAWQSLVTVRTGRVAPRVLVVAPTDASYAGIDNRLTAKTDARVFYLTGGANALAAYQSEQRRMAANPGAVFQSKSVQPHVVAKTGCGTCPK